VKKSSASKILKSASIRKTKSSNLFSWWSAEKPQISFALNPKFKSPNLYEFCNIHPSAIICVFT
jgi:hypothetical protein